MKLRKVFRKMRQQLIWFGGWELANQGGWRFRLPYGFGNEKWLRMSPTPISFWFNRLVIYGGFLDFKIGRGWLMIKWRPEFRMYWSPDGTPSRLQWEFGKGRRAVQCDSIIP